MHVTLFNLYEDFEHCFALSHFHCGMRFSSHNGDLGCYVELSQRYKSELHGQYTGNKQGLVPVWNGSLDCSFCTIVVPVAYYNNK